MKKITLLLLLVTGLANAQLTFTDPALKAYLLTSSASNNIAQDSAYQNVKIDANSNGQIEASEAAVVARLWIENVSITSLGGVEGFANLGEIGVRQTTLASVTLSPMPNLVNINFLENASLTYLNVSGMTELVQLSATDNPQLSQLITLNCSALATLIGYNNALVTMDMSGFTNLLNVYLNDNVLASVNFSGCTNLNGANLDNNNLTMIVVDGLASLAAIYCNNNPNLSIIHAAGCTSLDGNVSNYFSGDNAITYADFSGCTSLDTVIFNNNSLSTLNVSGCSSLISLECNHNSLTSLSFTGCSSMQFFDAGENQLSSFDFSGCTALQHINIGANLVTSLNTSGLPNLNWLNANPNPLANINTSDCPALVNFYYDYDNNEIVNYDVSNCTSLTYVNVSSDLLETFNVQGCAAMKNIWVEGLQSNAPLNALNLSGLSNLLSIDCSRTSVASLDLTGCNALTTVHLTTSPMSSLDLSHAPLLQELSVTVMPITELDVSMNPNLTVMYVLACPALTTIYAKNGAQENLIVNSFDSNLTYICQDDELISSTQAMLDGAAMSSVTCNSYCSFAPGGNYNTISGTILFDANNNGCGAGDIPQPDMKVTINDGINAGSTFTDAAGHYNFYTGAGNFGLTAALENPGFFNVSASAASVQFADQNNNVANVNICVAPNGVHPDAEIAVAPIIPARPGFVGLYRVTIKNKGNQTLSGNYSLAFEDDVLEFVSASIAPSSQTTGLLVWNYSNLLPFGEQTITILVNANSPTQTPALNAGDILDFTATVNPVAGDDNPFDNQFIYHESVTNSYDPNDLTCLEGAVVAPSQIGNYLHYIANFENLGTGEAENVVVKIVVDPDKYDINSLQLLGASHPSYTRVTGNTVEFIFEGIDLAAASGNPPVGGHGNVLFKIRSKNTLVAGDHVEKKANIYFDYNWPVETLPADTVFQLLSNPGFAVDESIFLYPNPTSGQLNIATNNNIQTVELFDIQGRLLRTEIVDAASEIMDISHNSSGIYFVRVTTAKGQKVEKIVKR
ncbi:MAG: T9SS type A sorting domain-containing protein [Flavobacterium sp.]|nr:MAG: T9SS type A sorting domain-containing protein [Flavobacterium sp.]